MGLSNEERFAKMAFAIDGIHNKYAELKSNFSDTETQIFESFVKGLWPAFMRGRTHNGALWILGSSYTADTGCATYLPHIAFEERLTALRQAKQKQADENDLAQRRLTWSVEEAKQHEAWERLCDVRDISDHKCSVTQNPSCAREWHARVQMTTTLWLYCEQLLYGLRRYSDGFADSFKELEDHVYNIMGFCFHEFHSNDEAFKAYLLHVIYQKVLRYDAKDVLNMLWVEQCLHHYVGPSEQYELESLYEMWKPIQPRSDLRLDERLWIVLRLMAPNFKDKYLAANIWKAIITWNLSNRASFLRKARAAMNKWTKGKETMGKVQMDRYCADKWCSITDQRRQPFPSDEARKAREEEEHKILAPFVLTPCTPKKKTKTHGINKRKHS